MTDVVIAPPEAGRSLWADAWARLKANKAAVISGVYLIFMGVLCIAGPWFTPHQFTTTVEAHVMHYFRSAGQTKRAFKRANHRQC